MDTEKLRALPGALRERCNADKWDSEAMKCMVYAKDSADLKLCASRLSPTQLEALATTMTAIAGAGKIGGSAGGWQALVTASPFETDPINLCGPIDPPLVGRTEESKKATREAGVAAASCDKAVEEQANDLQRRMHAQPDCKPCTELAAVVDERVSVCLAAVQSTPYKYVVFDAEKACAAYDMHIEFGRTTLKSGNFPAGTQGGDRLRGDLTSTQKQKAECLRQTKAAVKASRDARDAAAATADLGVLRDIPETRRTPGESARVASEISACRAEATRRREERLKIAATRDINELRMIDAQYQLPEEKERVAKADAERAARIEKRANDPKWAGPVLSAMICIAGEKKSDAAKEIKTEKAYASRYGGMIDKSKIYGLQQEIRAQDESVAEIRGLMRELKASVQGCRTPLVRDILSCLPREGVPGDAPVCRTTRVVEHLELIPSAETDP